MATKIPSGRSPILIEGSQPNPPVITERQKQKQLEQKLKPAPDRALDPRRSIGSGPSMGPRTTGGAPVDGAPKFGGDPGFKGPGSLAPAPKDNVDPGFGRKTMPAPRNYGGIQAQPMPYYPNQGGGGIKTMPYTPPKDGSGPKFENMPFKPAPQDKLKPAKPFKIPPKKMKSDMP
jgi:hypothetical protein